LKRLPEVLARVACPLKPETEAEKEFSLFTGSEPVLYGEEAGLLSLNPEEHTISKETDKIKS
jgi:hypothetical protein